MADIHLSALNDLFVQSDTNRNTWDNVFGEGGDDVIRMYQGTMIGGPGADRLERIPSTESWRSVGAAYWNSPIGIVANLAEGWIDDGFGTRDTVVGITTVHGSGQSDRFIGDDSDNFFHPNGGTDFMDGGNGFDGMDVREVPSNADGSGPRRPARLSDLDIAVAADGRTATIAVKHYPQITYTLSNIEYFQLIEPNQQFLLADFIKPQDMAQQAIAAGGATRWNAAQPLGTAINVSFSFITAAPASGPGAQGFRAFTPAEQQLVRDILAKTAHITQISFSEVTEGGGSVGQMRFGVSQQAATKGVAWLPGQDGDAAGDVWMDVDSMRSAAPGTEGYAALLHEIGHALGLRHPRNVDAGDAWPVQLREQDDRTALSVMSESRSGDGLFRADWGPLDVLALRYIYGTKAAASGDTEYALGALQGGSQTTVVDDGGIDTLDASALSTGVRLDLTPGSLGSAGITPAGFSGVDNLGVSADTLIEHAVGSPHDDVLLGNAANNTLRGGRGNDWIEGGAGTDTGAFEGRRADYEISNQFGKVFVKALDGVSGFDTLISIERLQFRELSLALDVGVGQSAGQTVLLLGATLPGQLVFDASKQGLLGAVIGLFDEGYSLRDLSGAVLRLPIWDVLTGLAAPTNRDIATYLLANVNGRAPDQATLDAASNALNTESIQGDWFAGLAGSAANQTHVGLVGLMHTGLEFVSPGA